MTSYLIGCQVELPVESDESCPESSEWRVGAGWWFRLYRPPSISERKTWGLLIVYILYITAAGNSISSQLGSTYLGNRYGTEKAGGTVRPSRAKSHLPGGSPPASQAGRRVGSALWPSASLGVTTSSYSWKCVFQTIVVLPSSILAYF
jgi:hypothetical protein